MDTHLDVLVVSDVHLGSDMSRVKELTRFLGERTIKKIILNGDIFDSANSRRLHNEDWEFLSLLRERSGNGTEIIWIAGNHDVSTKNFFALVGAQVCSEYIFSYNGERYLAIHGHQFDRFLIKNEMVGTTMGMPYRLLQKIEGKKQIVSRFVKRRYKSWLRLSKRVARGAASHALNKNIKNVVCGHTHQPMDMVVHGVRYLNSGSWADSPASYIAFAEGEVVVKSFK